MSARPTGGTVAAALAAAAALATRAPALRLRCVPRLEQPGDDHAHLHGRRGRHAGRAHPNPNPNSNPNPNPNPNPNINPNPNPNQVAASARPPRSEYTPNDGYDWVIKTRCCEMKSPATFCDSEATGTTGGGRCYGSGQTWAEAQKTCVFSRTYPDPNPAP